MTSPGILHRHIAETPIAVVDTETTGLYPSGDRVIEIAVVRSEPRSEPKVLVDTLINPKRAVGATEIHGISDADVADAPTFDEVAPAIVDALCGSVFAAYNVYFDARFIREELRRVGVLDFPPHLCLMYLRPMLGLGASAPRVMRVSIRASPIRMVTMPPPTRSQRPLCGSNTCWPVNALACGRLGNWRH